MINISEVKKFTKIRPEGKDNLILTVYLNTNRGRDPKEKYRIVLKDMAKRIEAEIGPNKNIRIDFEKIKNFLQYEFSKKAKGIFLFSCVRENIWHLDELEINLPNLAFIDKTPYIKPLLGIIEEYKKYCVILISKDRARIFTVYLGKIEEHFDVFDEVTGRHKKGGSSEARFQRHRKDEEHKHLKNVATKLFRFFKKERFDKIIIGSTPEVLPEFEKAIHISLRNRVAGIFHAELFAHTDNILKKSLEIEQIIEKKEADYKLAQLKNNLGPKKYAVSGIDDTLFELQDGRLNILIIKKGLRARGRQCMGCNYIDAWDSKKCPICGGKVQPIKDIIEKAIEIAFDKNVKVKFVDGDKEFERLGNIGGLLRY